MACPAAEAALRTLEKWACPPLHWASAKAIVWAVRRMRHVCHKTACRHRCCYVVLIVGMRLLLAWPARSWSSCMDLSALHIWQRSCQGLGMMMGKPVQVMCHVTAVKRYALTGDDACGGDVPEVLSLVVTLRKRLNSIPATVSNSPSAPRQPYTVLGTGVHMLPLSAANVGHVLMICLNLLLQTCACMCFSFLSSPLSHEEVRPCPAYLLLLPQAAA